MSLRRNIIIAGTTLLWPTFSGAADLCLSAYPIPATESVEFVTNWLREEGFTVSPADGCLSATKGDETIWVEVLPRSPLGSTLFFCCGTSLPSEKPTINLLKGALEEYVLSTGEGRGGAPLRIPDAVKARENSVVCLKATVNGQPVNFSGFVIGRQGFIVSTAHDLDGVTSVIVKGSDGEDLRGKIVSRDALSDLTLIRVKGRFGAAVDVAGGKRQIGGGERVYMVRCPPAGGSDIRVGSVSRQQAVVRRKLLWQVTMDVSPGSSGSPVFDEQGALVGVVKGRYRGTDSRGFLIPLDTLKEFLGQEKR